MPAAYVADLQAADSADSLSILDRAATTARLAPPRGELNPQRLLHSRSSSRERISMLNRQCKPRKRHFFRPKAELLEARRLLAGDVAAELIGSHTLTLEGDDVGNQIQIRGGRQDGDVTVKGLDGTTINGANGQSFSQIQRLVIRTHGGDDSVQIFKVALVDYEPLGSTITQAFAEIQVRGGDGDDEISIKNTSVSVEGQRSTFDAYAAITVYGDDGFASSSGNDEISISNVDVIAAATVERTYAQINVSSDDFRSAPGNDIVNLKDVDVEALGGLRSNLAMVSLQEFGGGGDDHYAVFNAEVRAQGPRSSSTISMRMGEGDDAGIVKNSSADKLFVRMDDGNDYLEVRNNDLALLARLDGGDGEDELLEKNNDGEINVFNFEL